MELRRKTRPRKSVHEGKIQDQARLLMYKIIIATSKELVRVPTSRKIDKSDDRRIRIEFQHQLLGMTLPFWKEA